MGNLRLNTGLLLLLGAVVCAGPDPKDAVPDWYHPAWRYRRRLFVRAPGTKPLRVSGTAVVRFVTLGRPAPDGSDIRVVVDNRRQVPHVLLDWGREDTALVAFRVPDSARLYYVYWGNPKAPKRQQRRLEAGRGWWPANLPKAGLYCEIRRLGPGNGDSWENMQALIAASRERLGFDRMKRLALGVNPFGESRDYLACWYGYLSVRKSGDWRFATNSNGPSFVLVDGKVVTSWPGWHSARGGASGKHSGTVYLSRGTHRFAYFFAARGKSNGHVCGIQGPGEKKLRVVSEEDFVPLVRCSAGPLEELGSEDVLDFNWTLTADAGLSDLDICSVKFVDRSKLADRKIVSWRWDFGDGQHAEGRTVEHVYLSQGIYTVEEAVVAAGGTVFRNVARIAVFPRGGRRLTARRIVDATSSYRLQELETRALWNLTACRWEDGRENLRLFYQAAQELFARRPKWKEGFAKYAEALLRHLFFRDPEATDKLVTYLLSQPVPPDLFCRASLVGSANLRFLSDKPEKAVELLEAGERKAARAALKDKELLFGVLLAELRGKKTAASPTGALQIDPKKLVAAGGELYSLERFLSEGKYGRAWEALWRRIEAAPDTIVEAPFLRARILKAAGYQKKAIKELEKALNPSWGLRPDQLSEALRLAVSLYKELGREAKAREAEKRLATLQGEEEE